MTVATTNSVGLRRFEVALPALLLWTACSGSDHAAPVGSQTVAGGSANAGASSGGRMQGSGATNHAGSSGSTSGGDNGNGGHKAGGANGDSGANGEGGANDEGGANGEGSSGRGGGIAGSSDAGGAGATGSDTPVGVCSGTIGASAGQRLDLSTTLADQLGGVTPDELVIAWTTVDADVVQLLTAERLNVDEAFGPAQARTIPAAPDRVALSPDGLRVVYVNADRRGFSSLSRDARGEPFATSEPFEYSLLNESDALPPGESYGDPVLSGSNLAFLYSRFGADRTQSLFVTHRFSAQAPWQIGRELAVSAEFSAAGAVRFQPTALTADEMTLFLWHSVSSQEYALAFDSNRLEYAHYTELGALAGATPNQGCTRVYYDSGSDSSDLFVAERR